MTTWKLFQNELPGPRLLAVEKDARLVLRDPARFAQVLRGAEMEL